MLMTPFVFTKKKLRFFFGSICLVSFKTRVRQSIDVAQKQILQKKLKKKDKVFFFTRNDYSLYIILSLLRDPYKILLLNFSRLS